MLPSNCFITGAADFAYVQPSSRLLSADARAEQAIRRQQPLPQIALFFRNRKDAGLER